MSIIEHGVENMLNNILVGMKFSKAVKEISKNGGVILSMVDKNVAYKFSDQDNLLMYDITPGSTKDPIQVTITSDMFTGDSLFYVSKDIDLEERRFSLSLGENLNVPSTKAEGTHILNAQLNTFLGVGHVRALEIFDKRFKGNILIEDDRDSMLAYAANLMFRCVLCSTVGARFKEKKKIAYKTREKLLTELIDVTASFGWYAGSQVAEQGGFRVCYFELPGFEQLSVATNKMPHNNKLFQGKWDGHRHSMLPKLERGLFKSGLYKLLNFVI